jgi:hypothetical protein
MKIRAMLAAIIAAGVVVSGCNHGMSTSSDGGGNRVKRDRSQRTVIDTAQYVDFTIPKYNARTVRREDMLYALNGVTYHNENSSIKIKSMEGTIEIISDNGFYKGKNGCQVYGIFGLDIQAASEDCLYIRHNPRKDGFVMIDGQYLKDEEIPDLEVCLPLYGYSRNRIEVSSIMDGFIVMPSGTYWKR